MYTQVMKKMEILKFRIKEKYIYTCIIYLPENFKLSISISSDFRKYGKTFSYFQVPTLSFAQELKSAMAPLVYSMRFVRLDPPRTFGNGT